LHFNFDIVRHVRYQHFNDRFDAEYQMLHRSVRQSVFTERASLAHAHLKYDNEAQLRCEYMPPQLAVVGVVGAVHCTAIEKCWHGQIARWQTVASESVSARVCTHQCVHRLVPTGNIPRHSCLTRSLLASSTHSRTVRSLHIHSVCHRCCTPICTTSSARNRM
jgi:hypothetical protein